MKLYKVQTMSSSA